MFKRIIIVALVAAGGYFYWYKHDAPKFSPVKVADFTKATDAADAFRDQRSGVMVSAEGSVERLLDDDNKGARHQRFILRLASGQTLLVAHNIDLAPRVPVAVGTELKLYGEYEWNDKGGVVHWTHKDPQGGHEAGWIEVGGKRYE